MGTDALIFDVERIRFGIRAADVKQVLQAVEISKLDAPSLLEGIVNIRGVVVPVLDFRQYLQLPAKDPQVSDHLLVLETAAHDVAIRVDEALDLIEVDGDALEQTKIDVAGVDFTGTIAETALGLIHVLDADLLLSPADSSMLGDWLKLQSMQDAPEGVG